MTNSYKISALADYYYLLVAAVEVVLIVVVVVVVVIAVVVVVVGITKDQRISSGNLSSSNCKERYQRLF